MKWTPPERPEWVLNLNAHGESLRDPSLLVPIVADELIEKARASTGLDDFGPEPEWRPHLQVLTHAIETESNLHLAGRIISATEILRSLRNRLQTRALWKKRPEILDTPIKAPVFVVGSARSGTSITHVLLACDPGSRVPLLWEMLHPAEAARGVDRMRVADETMQFWHQLQPEYETMHYNAGNLPNECIYIFMQSFVSDQWLGCHEVPSYGAHIQSLDQRFVYEEHRRVLQTLAPGPGAARWVLKAPSHLALLRSLFSVYPDARIILTHRDPLKTLASGLSLMGTLKWMRCAEVDLAPLTASMPQGQAWLWQDLIDARKSGELPDRQFIDVRYADLMARPADTIRKIYSELGWSFADSLGESVSGYTAQKPRHAHGRHSYALEDFGLDAKTERQRYAFYQDRFGIEDED